MSYLNHSINDSPTIYGEASAAMTDLAMKVVSFDENGKIAFPTADSVPLGVTLASQDDVAEGERVDVQIKDACYVVAGGDVKRGDTLEAGTDGKVKKAESGKYTIGIALSSAKEGKPVEMLIYRMNAGGSGSGGSSYAPISHTHKAADITDGTTAFAEKSHTHTKSDITDLES